MGHVSIEAVTLEGGRPGRVILHLDMDAFFASVEVLRHPELRGRPVVVGGDGPRGVVAAASYEARSYGVFSAMSSVRARRLCPDAVFLHGDHAHYAAVSRRIMEILRQVTPLVEPLSLDEAFCDVTGTRRTYPDVRVLATTLREEIRASEGLECAVGVGASKFVAKVASKHAKPRAGRPGAGPRPGPGILVVDADDQSAFLTPLPVREIWGVGPATLRRLSQIGVVTIGDLAATPPSALEHRLGTALGTQLHQLANGIDPRPVLADRPPKSIGHEETYNSDLVDPSQLSTEVLRLADATATRLHENGLECRTVQLKVRFADFTTITRAQTLSEPTASSRDLAATARRLLSAVDTTRAVRLLGVAVSNLMAPAQTRQLSLTLDDGSSRSTDGVVDAVRARFGPGAIAPAALVVGSELEVRRRGDQQWGKSSRGR